MAPSGEAAIDEIRLTGGTGRRPRLGQQRRDLLVGGLAEVLVPEPDRPHRLGGLQAHDLVELALERCDRLWRADRDGQDEPSRVAVAQRSCGRARAAAGRQAVVDEDHRPALDVKCSTLAAVALGSRAKLRLRVRYRVLELLGT